MRLRLSSGVYREITIPLAALSKEVRDALNELVRTSRERRPAKPLPVIGLELTPPSADTLYEDGHTYVWQNSVSSTALQTDRYRDGDLVDVVVQHLENQAVYGSTTLSYSGGEIQSSTYIPESEVAAGGGDPGDPPPEMAGENCGEYISKAIAAWVNHIKAIREYNSDGTWYNKAKMVVSGTLAIGWKLAAIAECEL